MRSIDTPAGRPLDDFHDLPAEARARKGGVPDGRARSPAELFDNLRLRLSELPASHPSSPRPADRPESAGRYGPAGQDAPLDQDQDDRRATPVVGGPQDTRQGERRDTGRAGRLDEAIVAARIARDTSAGAVDTGALTMKSFATELNSSEAYAPWFMSGEEAVPWWAAGDDLWG